MTATDDAGVERRTTGVIGALELSPPGTDILPHEHTTKKAKSDRLDLLRSCRANLSAIWGLSLAKGLTDLLPVDDAPLADVVDEDGVRHTVWRVDDPATCAAISAAVAEQPVVVADGHHRYETSLAYKAERAEAPTATRARRGGHARLRRGAGRGRAHRARHPPPHHRPPRRTSTSSPRWRRGSRPSARRPTGVPITTAMVDAGLPRARPPGRRGAAAARGPTRWPTRATSTRAASTSPSPRSPTHDLRFQHGVANVRGAVASGAAQAGVLLRPATVAQIEATAHGGERMPPKTTFFHPKPKTGLVFRSLG